MRKFHLDKDNTYILLRAFDLESDNPGIKFFSDPWGLYLDRVLDFRAAGGYRVFAG